MSTAAGTLPVTAAHEAAFLRLIDAHGPALRRLAASVERDAGRREDLVQEIHLALWQAVPSFRGECAERTFVFRVAHNRAVSHVRHWRRRAVDPLDHAEAVHDPGADVEAAAAAGQRHARLREAVPRLPLGLRHAIVLTLEGLSAREVGEVLGVAEGTVAVRLTRARKALRRLLDEMEAAR